MPETRSFLTASLSFNGSASTSEIPRPLKRRLASTPELSFFTPAAQSFKPRPYTPNNTFDSTSTPSPIARNASVASLAIPAPVMDPSPSDPHALFLHPPFNVFPDYDLYPEGLSYSLLAANPEWFLDAADFITSVSANANAVAYPPQLEPPRGWCPAKKKDLKERGSDGWPEGEEPRLRCTFCRRTYAGVNAKSMWRRHVFEKHKIAMANRRDGNERVRGRGSNKENKQNPSGKESGDVHGKAAPMTVTHQQQPQFTIIQSKPKYRSLLPADSACAKVALAARIGRSNEQDRVPFPSAPVIPQKEFLAHDHEHSSHPFTQPSFPTSPPLTPNTPPQEAVFDTIAHSSSEPQAISPPTACSIVPPSPYDPAATPTFRHSPPTLPWDHPWRFPSPSHPLHSRARELSLSMLTADVVSPTAKGPNSSPSIMASSPNSSTDAAATIEGSYGASPKALFSKGLPVPITDRMYTEKHRRRIQESPLSRTTRPRHASLKFAPEAAEEWFFAAPLHCSPGLIRSASDGLLDSSTPLDSQDPFATIYRPLVDTGYLSNGSPQDDASPPGSSSEMGSPVLRTNTLPIDSIGGIKSDSIGLGIGLMDPFHFFDGRVEGDFYNVVFPSIGEDVRDENEVETSTALASMAYEHTGDYGYIGGFDTASPPSRKKRRTIDNLA